VSPVERLRRGPQVDSWWSIRIRWSVAGPLRIAVQTKVVKRGRSKWQSPTSPRCNGATWSPLALGSMGQSSRSHLSTPTRCCRKVLPSSGSTPLRENARWDGVELAARGKRIPESDLEIALRYRRCTTLSMQVWRTTMKLPCSVLLGRSWDNRSGWFARDNPCATERDGDRG